MDFFSLGCVIIFVTVSRLASLSVANVRSSKTWKGRKNIKSLAACNTKSWAFFSTQVTNHDPHVYLYVSIDVGTVEGSNFVAEIDFHPKKSLFIMWFLFTFWKIGVLYNKQNQKTNTMFYNNFLYYTTMPFGPNWFLPS